MSRKLGVVTLMLIASASCFGQQSTKSFVLSPNVVFEGTVLQVGPAPSRISGRLAVYQLVKYRVDRICQGAYSEKEMVVDHLILYRNQLRGLRIGQRVCIGVNKSAEVFERNNVKGIRSPTEAVNTFYIGGQVSPTMAIPCSCPNYLFRPNSSPKSGR
jgi:hypothetical protein